METAPLTVRGAEDIEYSIWIGPGLLESALPAFVAERGATNIAIVTNVDLAPLYGEPLAARIPGSYVIAVPEGEQHKRLETVGMVYDGLLEHHADRSTLLVALGGGVIGDLAGFAAATYMRGLPLIQAPTSLLAMVDSSVGAKTGVDLPQGKNLVGVFKDPIAVFADTSALKTLPDAEFRCGLAETIKAGMIADPDLFEQLAESGPEPIEDAIRRAVKVKIDV
ncbi:MAG: 3-dehydroquinate synthase, partial [Anaerolineae bacterium]|nr:3-dehydroquinate synthase [Anaerolineae bacterium]